MKNKLIEKIKEKFVDLEPEELLGQVGLDFLSVIETAVDQKLSEMTEDQLLEIL